jgi:hypothetical protein
LKLKKYYYLIFEKHEENIYSSLLHQLIKMSLKKDGKWNIWRRIKVQKNKKDIQK